MVTIGPFIIISTTSPGRYTQRNFDRVGEVSYVCERAHIAYYLAMDFKEKVNRREGTSSASSIFWATFQDFYEEIVNNPNDNSEFLIVYMGLMERKKLQRGISISESSLSKILQHQSMSMYNETNLKIEFELHTRRF